MKAPTIQELLLVPKAVVMSFKDFVLGLIGFAILPFLALWCLYILALNALYYWVMEAPHKTK